jgi:hypothetical protein
MSNTTAPQIHSMIPYMLRTWAQTQQQVADSLTEFGPDDDKADLLTRIAEDMLKAAAEVRKAAR